MENFARRVCAALAFLMCVQSTGLIAEEIPTEPERSVQTAAPHAPEATRAESGPDSGATGSHSSEPTQSAHTPAPTMSTHASDPTPSPSPSPTPTVQAQHTLSGDEDQTPEATADTSSGPTYGPGAETPTAVPEIGEGTDEPTVEPEVTPVAITEDQAEEEVETEEVIHFVRPNKNPGFYGAKPSDARGMQIPLLLQGSYPEIVCYVGDTPRSVATSGCGATSLSMVIAYLTGNTEQTPYTLFCKAVDSGRYHGNGLDHGTLSSLGAAYGVKSKWIANSADAIIAALEAGKPVIAHMGPGLFTNNGHYIVLRGVTEDGLILVNDPNSAKLSRYAYPVETFIKQARGGSSFMVCWSEGINIAAEAEQEKEPEEVEEIVDVVEETEPEEVEEVEEVIVETAEEVEEAVTESSDEAEPEEAVEAVETEEPRVQVVVRRPTIEEQPTLSEEAEEPAETQTESDAVYVYTLRDRVLIRGRAGTGGRVLATLVEPGVKLKILETVEHSNGEIWYKVFYAAENVFGYVRADLVASDTDRETAESVTVQPTEVLPVAEETDTTTEEQQAEVIVTPVEFENRVMVTRYERVGIYSEPNDRLKPLAMINDAGVEVMITDILLDEHGSVWYYAIYEEADVEGYIRAGMLSVPMEQEEADMEPETTAEEESAYEETRDEAAESISVETEADIPAADEVEEVLDTDDN